MPPPRTLVASRAQIRATGSPTTRRPARSSQGAAGGPVPVRLDAPTRDRLDAAVAALQVAAGPCASVTRASVIRGAILRELDRVEAKTP